MSWTSLKSNKKNVGDEVFFDDPECLSNVTVKNIKGYNVVRNYKMLGQESLGHLNILYSFMFKDFLHDF